MELVSGIARNVRASAGADTLNLDLGGRDVRLENPEHDSRRVQDDDKLIVAGNQESGTVVGYAYRNITQGYWCRASCRDNAFQGVLTLIFSLGAGWAAFDAQSEIPLFLWTQRVVFLALALLFGVFTITLVIIIVEKFLAGFRVNRAALETLRGSARNVRLSTDRSGAYLDIDASRVELLFMPRKIVIANDDEVVVVGQRVGDVLTGMSYRNVTRGISGRSWTVVGLLSTLLWIGVLLAFLITGLWFGGDEAAIFIAIRRALALALMMATLVFALDRFFRWRLDLEAWRRVRAGPR